MNSSDLYQTVFAPEDSSFHQAPSMTRSLHSCHRGGYDVRVVTTHCGGIKGTEQLTHRNRKRGVFMLPRGYNTELKIRRDNVFELRKEVAKAEDLDREKVSYSGTGIYYSDVEVWNEMRELWFTEEWLFRKLIGVARELSRKSTLSGLDVVFNSAPPSPGEGISITKWSAINPVVLGVFAREMCALLSVRDQSVEGEDLWSYQQMENIAEVVGGCVAVIMRDWLPNLSTAVSFWADGAVRAWGDTTATKTAYYPAHDEEHAKLRDHHYMESQFVFHTALKGFVSSGRSGKYSLKGSSLEDEYFQNPLFWRQICEWAAYFYARDGQEGRAADLLRIRKHSMTKGDVPEDWSSLHDIYVGMRHDWDIDGHHKDFSESTNSKSKVLRRPRLTDEDGNTVIPPLYIPHQGMDTPWIGLFPGERAFILMLAGSWEADSIAPKLGWNKTTADWMLACNCLAYWGYHPGFKMVAHRGTKWYQLYAEGSRIPRPGYPQCLVADSEVYFAKHPDRAKVALTRLREGLSDFSKLIGLNTTESIPHKEYTRNRNRHYSVPAFEMEVWDTIQRVCIGRDLPMWTDAFVPSEELRTDRTALRMVKAYSLGGVLTAEGVDEIMKRYLSRAFDNIEPLENFFSQLHLDKFASRKGVELVDCHERDSYLNMYLGHLILPVSFTYGKVKPIIRPDNEPDHSEEEE